MKREIFVHPFFFAFFSILFLYSHNIGSLKTNITLLSLTDLFIPLSISFLFTIALWFCFSFILKDNKKIPISVTLSLFLFFSYGHVHDFVLMTTSILLARHRYFIFFWLFLFVLGFVLLLRVKNYHLLYTINKILNLISFSLILMSFFNIGFYTFKDIENNRKTLYKIENRIENNRKTEKAGNSFSRSKVRRNIYYIILDSYSNNTTLQEVYNYSNQPFTDYLTKKGFYISYKSLTNYPSTIPSLSSSLNMQYLDFSTADLNGWMFAQMMKNNAVSRFLKARGYKVITLDSATINKEKKFSLFSEFNMLLMRTTLLEIFANSVDGYIRRKEIPYIFDKLAELSNIESPVFVFAHILCPHPPFVFGPNGESISLIEEAASRMGKVHNQYVNQVKFVNRRIKHLLDIILSNSENPPIIIIQGDHGWGHIFRPILNSKGLPDDRFLKAQIRIFNAYYLPGNSKKLLYDSITPVNTFRIIFNYYFTANFPLLKDRSFYPSHAQPYNFVDVTDKVRFNNEGN